MQYDLIVGLVQRWEWLTIELVEKIEQWRREGCPRDDDRHFQCSDGYVPSENLYQWTMQIGAIITTAHLPLETSPLFEFGLAVRGCLVSRTGETLPPPLQLDLLHRRCLMIVHAVGVDAARHLKRASQDKPVSTAGTSKTPAPPRVRQTRLKAVTDTQNPHLFLDGEPIPCSNEVALHFVAKLIEADGERVSFSEWIKGHPEFSSARSNRVLDALPEQIRGLIESSKGKPPRLRVEALANLHGKAW